MESTIGATKVTQPDPNHSIEGLIDAPQLAADGSVYTGRATLYDLQWTLSAGDPMATCAVTVRQLVDLARNRLIWVDHNVQRGLKPGSTAPAVVPLADGYPGSTDYVFDASRADDIAEKLLHGKKLFLNPLVWNLRPGSFSAHYSTSSSTRSLFLYSGRIYVPDSHHRHQAIFKAASIFEEAPQDYPHFSLDHQFTVELYFMSIEDEGEYFYEKNQLGKTADKSRAYELTTEDSLSTTAKLAAEKSPSLTGNVNRVTDRLTSKNPQVITLSTLRSMVGTFAGDDHISPEMVQTIAESFADYYELLATVRPELGHLDESDRKQVRAELVSDQAVFMHGYALLMRALDQYISEGTDKASLLDRLEVLAGPDPDFPGVDDVMRRDNPRWLEMGVLQKTKSGKLTISNTRQTRATIGRFLSELVLEGLESGPTSG